MMAKMVDGVFSNRHQQIVNQRQNQHEEAVCQCIQPNRENGSRVNAPCRGEVDDVPLGCSIERKYDDETTAGACRGLDSDDGRN